MSDKKTNLAASVAARLLNRADKSGTGHLFARKGLILREADFTRGPLHKRAGDVHEHPEREPHGMPLRRRRLQVSPPLMDRLPRIGIVHAGNQRVSFQ